MRQPRSLAALLCTVLALSACADQPVMEPDLTPEASASLDSELTSIDGPLGSLTAEPAPRHLVVFKGKAPKNFEDRVADLGGNVFHLSTRIGYAGVEGLDDEAATALGALKGVSMVEPEAIFTLAEPTAMTEPQAVGLQAAPTSPEDPAAAFFFPRQWHLRAVAADQAWSAGRLGSPDVTVAILDTGIGYTHPDLAGLVDLDRSISFIPDDDAFVAALFPGAHPIADIGFHGTHVAATVASNGDAAAGVTSRTTLMGVKVCSVVTGGCPGIAILQGIEHAVENGAAVINMSLGGWFRKSAFPGAVSTYSALMNYARQGDVTVVVAAGNDANDLDRQHNIAIRDGTGAIVDRIHVPSFFATYCDAVHVVCVAATGPTAAESVDGPWEDIDAPATYTNFGRSAIDVAAPGGSTGGSVTAACSPFSLLQGLTVCQTGVFVVGASGTSMAAPHVAGLAALAVEDVGRNVAQVRAYIRNSADAMGGGNTAFYGKGRINVGNAVGAN